MYTLLFSEGRATIFMNGTHKDINLCSSMFRQESSAGIGHSYSPLALACNGMCTPIQCSIASSTDPLLAIKAYVYMFSTKDSLQQFPASLGVLASTTQKNCLFIHMTACAHKFRTYFYFRLKISNTVPYKNNWRSFFWPCWFDSVLVYAKFQLEFPMLLVSFLS